VTSAADPRERLVRDISLAAAVAIILAQVIGTGVFVKARVMTCSAGTPGLVLGAWLAGGVFTLAGALAYAELGAMFPRSGGEFHFLRAAYGRATAFLFGWMLILVGKSGSQAALATAAAIFLNDWLGGGLSPLAEKGVALGAIALATSVNLASVRNNSRLASALAAVKIGLIGAVALAGFFFSQGAYAHFAGDAAGAACADVPASARFGLAGFGAAVLGALWGYSGWGNLTMLGAELRQPDRNLPRAMSFGIAAIVALYLLANAAYFFALSPERVASVAPSASVAHEVVVRAFGAGAAGLMAAALLVSSFGSLHVSMLTGSRVPYALAQGGLFPAAFGAVSERFRSPWVAVLAQGGWAALLALSGSFDELTDFTVFGGLIFQALAVAAVFVLRHTQPEAPRPYRAWGYPLVPALYVAATGWLVVSTLLATPARALAGLGLIALGIPVYGYFARQQPNEQHAAHADTEK
jgi:APA family basic amino acid/polyamine antiporter